MSWDAEKPFNQLPLLPPHAEQLESVIVLKACIKARAALAELKQAGELLPDQGLLINLIPLLEAKDSSEIENIVTTSDKLFQFSQEESQADPATKEALRYRTALYDGFKNLYERPLCTSTAVKICRTLKNAEMDIRRVPGARLVSSDQRVVYTPPEGESVIRDLLSNWESFIHAEDDIDPLVKMAITHYQFEAIHPFPDGNGRTGRILNILFLIEKDLLTLPILYLSRHIVSHKADYYNLLRGVTASGDWEPWILFMLKAVEATSIWTTAKIAAVRELLAVTTSHIRQSLPKIYSHELVQIIFEQPYCRISNLIDNGIARRQTASVYLKQLCEIGVLNEISFGREKLYVHPRLIQLMTRDENAVVAY
ncbi:Fic family protein [Erwiniaceae bacterium BAC15a-03b]|uniref:Protein adenylyltransferase n=1 Tax=Winslowiella arboricola TaxID=2978220 RepID=A0A9J6PIB3_9GAMM|nr:Fic family protein [Winslowiella arboricola]MCU5771633.1 Fic family protein [Winslowiella arboricola]MCU5776446.1 Fic family protein [Winslowiella arboricola]